MFRTPSGLSSDPSAAASRRRPRLEVVRREGVAVGGLAALAAALEPAAPLLGRAVREGVRVDLAPGLRCRRSSPTASEAMSASSRSPARAGRTRRAPRRRRSSRPAAPAAPTPRSPSSGRSRRTARPRRSCPAAAGRGGRPRGRSRRPRRSRPVRRAGAPCPRRTTGRGTRCDRRGSRTGRPPSSALPHAVSTPPL